MDGRANVRNTRRSIGDTPYLPLPSSAQPPELHHFRKNGIAAGMQVSFGAAQVGASKG